MVNENLICKIYFFDEGLKKTIRILGIINRNQLFSSLDNYIELKNYGNKAISKSNLEKVIVYENQQEIFVDRQVLEVKNQIKIES